MPDADGVGCWVPVEWGAALQKSAKTLQIGVRRGGIYYLIQKRSCEVA